MDVGQTLGIGVAGHDNVRLLRQQGLKGIEKLFLGAVFVGKELHIVNEEQVERVVVVFELVKGLALVGFHHIRDKLLGMDVQHLGVGLVEQQLVAHSMHQMGFAQAHPAVNEQGVVELTRHIGHMHGGGAGHAVGRALHQRVKAQAAVEAILESIEGTVRAGGRLKLST